MSAMARSDQSLSKTPPRQHSETSASAIPGIALFRAVPVRVFLLVTRWPLQGTSEADHRLSVATFPGLREPSRSSVSRVSDGLCIEEQRLVPGPDKPLNLIETIPFSVNDDPAATASFDTTSILTGDQDSEGETHFATFTGTTSCL